MTAEKPWGGPGLALVNGKVKRATWCQLKLLSSHTLPVVYSHNPKKCTSGSYTAHVNVVIGPDSRPG